MSRREEFLRRLGRNPQNPYAAPEPMVAHGQPTNPPLLRPTSLLTMPTSEMLPDVAKKAAVAVYQGDAPPDERTAGEYNATGGAWRFFSPDISIYPQNLNQPWSPANQVMAHEVGHSIWQSSTNPEEQAQWEVIHQRALQPRRGAHVQLPQEAYGGQGEGPFVHYRNDPSHSFAEAYGAYVTQPEWLKRNYLAAYDFFKKKLGFEYSRRIGAQ